AVRTGRTGSRWTGSVEATGGGPGGADVDAVVEEALAVDATHRSLEKSRVEMMRGYAETLDCRRRYLLGYFGEAAPATCGTCDVCTGRAADPRAADTAPPAARPRETAGPHRRGLRSRAAARPGPKSRPGGGHPYPPGARVRHERWGEGEVMSDAEGRLTVLFDSVGYRTLSLAVVTDKQLLAALPAARR
ncbi:DUF3553 domain-containing protein, partial [Actinacidiphila rubida]